jgi:hypothetical protein
MVLFDPLLPTHERDAFLEWLDERVAGLPVSILTTIRWHRRDRDELAARYRANSARAWNRVPAGVEPKPLHRAGEILFWLPGALTLVAGDRLIGAEGGEAGRELRVCPESWLEGVSADRVEVAGFMRQLLELPIERVLVSHGQPVLRGGHGALARAIAEARGEPAPAR